MKNNKGITLVALIITIIVLLIIAVIAIRQVTNKNIVTEAQNAREKYVGAQANEEVDIQNSVDYIREVKNQIQNNTEEAEIIEFTVARTNFTVAKNTTWETFANSREDFSIEGNRIIYHGGYVDDVVKTDIIRSKRLYN